MPPTKSAEEDRAARHSCVGCSRTHHVTFTAGELTEITGKSGMMVCANALLDKELNPRTSYYLALKLPFKKNRAP